MTFYQILYKRYKVFWQNENSHLSELLIDEPELEGGDQRVLVVLRHLQKNRADQTQLHSYWGPMLHVHSISVDFRQLSAIFSARMKYITTSSFHTYLLIWGQMLCTLFRSVFDNFLRKTGDFLKTQCWDNFFLLERSLYKLHFFIHIGGQCYTYFRPFSTIFCQNVRFS
jgi:hypothetical protein